MKCTQVCVVSDWTGRRGAKGCATNSPAYEWTQDINQLKSELEHQKRGTSCLLFWIISMSYCSILPPNEAKRAPIPQQNVILSTASVHAIQFHENSHGIFKILLLYIMSKLHKNSISGVKSPLRIPTEHKFEDAFTINLIFHTMLQSHLSLRLKSSLNDCLIFLS